MPTGTKSVPRFDWGVAADRRQLILSGVVWSLAGLHDLAVDEVLGDPTLVNEKTPPDVLALIEQQSAERESDPWGGQPVK